MYSVIQVECQGLSRSSSQVKHIMALVIVSCEDEPGTRQYNIIVLLSSS
jgi:hypothetical protein